MYDECYVVNSVVGGDQKICTHLPISKHRSIPPLTPYRLDNVSNHIIIHLLRRARLPICMVKFVRNVVRAAVHILDYRVLRRPQHKRPRFVVILQEWADTNADSDCLFGVYGRLS